MAPKGRATALKILGLGDDATDDDVRAAYQTFQKKWCATLWRRASLPLRARSTCPEAAGLPRAARLETRSAIARVCAD